MLEERDITDKNGQRLHVGWKVLLGASTVAVRILQRTLCSSNVSEKQT